MTSADGRDRARWRVQPGSTFNSRGPLAIPRCGFDEIKFKPRLFFYDRNLWETALKLKSQVENLGSMHRQHAEALGIVLTHELVTHQR